MKNVQFYIFRSNIFYKTLFFYSKDAKKQDKKPSLHICWNRSIAIIMIIVVVVIRVIAITIIVILVIIVILIKLILIIKIFLNC